MHEFTGNFSNAVSSFEVEIYVKQCKLAQLSVIVLTVPI